MEQVIKDFFESMKDKYCVDTLYDCGENPEKTLIRMSIKEYHSTKKKNLPKTIEPIRNNNFFNYQQLENRYTNSVYSIRSIYGVPNENLQEFVIMLLEFYKQKENEIHKR